MRPVESEGETAGCGMSGEKGSSDCQVLNIDEGNNLSQERALQGVRIKILI